MKFSLYMIEDALKDYTIEECFTGEISRTIENIRLYSEGCVMKEHTLYIETGDRFFHNGDASVVCVHNGQMLRIQSDSVNGIFNRILQFFEERKMWEDRIGDMITSNCLLEEVLDQFQDIVPLPIMVLDNGQMVLATSGNYGAGTIDEEWDIALKTGRFRSEILAEYNTKYQSRIGIRDFYEIPADPFPYSSFNRNIFIENEFVGFISMILVHEIREVYKDWFDIACEAILKWITLYMQKNEILLRQEMFLELLGGQKEHLSKFIHTMQTAGWNQKDNMKLLVLHCISDVLNMNLHITKLLNHISGALFAVEYQNEIVVLLNERIMPEKKFVSEVVPILQRSSYYAGESDTFVQMSNIYQCYLQARVAMTYGEALPGTIHPIREHMVPYIFQVMIRDQDMDMRHPCLVRLREYDELHGTNLYDVLDIYLQCGCSQTAAAERLYLHRNSLIRKIEKIQEIFPVNLNDHEIRLHLMMSYEMDRRI